MELKIKLCIFLGATIYLFFLGWYFSSQNNSNGTQWHNTEKYTTLNTTTFAASQAPAADEIFDSKLKVKMKRAPMFRRRKVVTPSNHHSKNNLSFSTTKYFQTQRFFAISPVGEGIHAVSNSKFTSFGAWGLMGIPMPNTSQQKNLQQNRTNHSTTYHLPAPMMGVTLPIDNNQENKANSTIIIPQL